MTRTAADNGAHEGSGSWEELLTVALLGTERRKVPGPVPVTGGGGTGEGTGPAGEVADTGSGAALAETTALVDRSDAAVALLDLAAVGAVHRRAGLRPGPAAEPPPVAPDDTRPELPAAARRRLAMLLADRPGPGSGSRGATPNLTELLHQVLAAANRFGYRAPAALIPALLDAARGRSDLRPDALALAGPRGLWLAGLNPDWKFALRFVPPRAADGTAHAAPEHRPGGPDQSDQAAEHRLWEEGLFAERVTLLSRIRRRDPGAALVLLRSTWQTERAEERLLFLDSLRERLSADDEPFLDQALDDRSRNVRSTAAKLLSALPGSALSARMAERASACVTLETADAPGSTATPGTAGTSRGTGGAFRRLTVEAPCACDAAMERDGIVAKAPTGTGERAWWLGQLVESAPLSLWTRRFGLSPRDIVALPVAEGWHGDLHAAWSRAAVRQHDTAWARALLGSPPSVGGDADSGDAGAGPRSAPRGGTATGTGAGAPTGRATAGSYAPTTAGTSGDPSRLLSVLPDEERAAWVAGFIETHGLTEAFQMLGACAVPWAEPLGSAVIDALDIARDSGSYPWSFSGVMGLAERCLDPAQAARVDVLTAVPETDGAPGAGSYWSEAFQRLASTLRLRATMLEELQPAP